MADSKREEEATRVRADRRETLQREWTEKSDLPDPTYNPNIGWTLDEFAMYVDANGLREYKKKSYNLHHPKMGLSTSLGVDDFIFVHKFPIAIQDRLLGPTFRVMGIRPNGYQPEEAALPLLEKMVPIIETSELLDVTQWPDIAIRRYEHVRVFRLSGSRGAQAKYDWRRLARQMEEAGVNYLKDADLVRFCRRNVGLVSGEKPDHHQAVERHRLETPTRGYQKSEPNSVGPAH